LRLRSDVPIAFLLSGGVDSNALASIAKKHFNQNVSTFSIINKDKRFDESNYIDIAQKNLKTNHTNLKFDFSRTNFLKKLRNQIIYHDSPVTMVNSFLQFELLKMIKRKGFKVVISGLGADELFSGYYDHHLLYLNEIKQNKNLLKKSINNWSKLILPVVRNPYLRKFDLYIKNKNFRKHIFQNDEFKKDLFIKSSKTEFQEESYCKSLMKNRMINELQHEIVPGGLKEDDLNSMYNSIENRSPYLDSKLFQDCLNIPAEHYIRDGMAKWPLRKIIKNLVPDVIRLKKEKVGFNTTISDVIDFKKKKNINFLLSDSEIFKIVKKKSLINLINKEYFSGTESNFLFTFISSKIFLENFK
ncbi:asparagine synthase C-terminal domain-containing protein, partial [Candidatus Pelagibacter sp.]|nr:asparagine synthase C-terminal domain-containing protein [Candidatus Pelagibacter sp.]